MTWRERLGRVGRPVVSSIARVLRGDSEAEDPPLQAAPVPSAVQPISAVVALEPERTSEAKAPSLPPWGLPPSQVPPRLTLLPGPSSLELFRRSRRVAAWGFASYAVVVVAAFIIVGKPGPVALFALVALVVGGAVLGLVGSPYVERTKEEHRAGYTVWRQNTLWKPQVDAETGFVIRPAGARTLSKQEEAAALKRVGEIARYLDGR